MAAAAILKIKTLQYPRNELTDFDEIWCYDASRFPRILSANEI